MILIYMMEHLLLLAVVDRVAVGEAEAGEARMPMAVLAVAIAVDPLPAIDPLPPPPTTPTIAADPPPPTTPTPPID